MKAFHKILLSILLSGSFCVAYAQDDTVKVGKELKEAGKSTGKAVKKAAKDVGNKAAEVGAKGAAAVSDKALKDRKGPHGETVYVDKYDRKYYVNKKGKRIYLK